MAVGFGTIVTANVVTSATTVVFSSVSVTSGQPIVVNISGNAASGSFSIADTFSTPYTWTLVTSVFGATGNANLASIIYVGTGGSGTSGNITVSGINNTTFMGGAAVPLTGASSGVGLAIVDHSGTASSSSNGTTITSPTLTPTTGTEGALYFPSSASKITAGPSSPWANTFINCPAASGNTGSATVQSAPTSGVGLSTTWTQTSAAWNVAAVLILSTPPPPPPVSTNKFGNSFSALQRASSR